jgi:hypothetical protein
MAEICLRPGTVPLAAKQAGEEEFQQRQGEPGAKAPLMPVGLFVGLKPHATPKKQKTQSFPQPVKPPFERGAYTAGLKFRRFKTG